MEFYHSQMRRHVINVLSADQYDLYSRMRNMGTNFVLLNVTAGESVWPQYLGDSDSRRIYADGVTTFSGFLLHEF